MEKDKAVFKKQFSYILLSAIFTHYWSKEQSQIEVENLKLRRVV
jgi:hypothetical protein